MGAAWVLNKYFNEEGWAANFHAANYSDEPPWDLIDGAKVYIVDFSWPREKMIEIAKRAESVLVLDHHQTAQAALQGLEGGNLKIVFDMNRSGAGIAWDYFFPNQPHPDLVDYVEDRDLWRFNLASSREINAFIQSFDISLPVWIKEFGYHGNLSSTDVKAGEALLRQQSKLVREIAANAYFTHLPITEVLPGDISNGIFVRTGCLFSEVCEQMLKDHPEAEFAFYEMYRVKDGKYQYGLRSRAGSDIDVSVIAKLYGGGGHKNAAGFEL